VSANTFSTADESYFLEVGNKDEHRLKIMNQILNPNSQSFLKAYIKTGMSVLEIGCGVGIMTCWISEIVGVKGKVVAIDSSLEQLEIAKSNAKKLGITNIKFMHLDFKDIRFNGEFDICYSRYLMIHLKAPKLLLSTYYNCLTNGGYALLEEPIISDISTYPETHLWDEIVELYKQASENNGVDLDIGCKLFSLIDDSDLDIIQCNASQAYISKELSLKYYYAALEAMGDVFKINNEEEFNRIKVNDPSKTKFLYGKYMNVIQVSSQKS
jgi:ubiquinone/menaquinone biosynthesis C-methylase UbiE